MSYDLGFESDDALSLGFYEWVEHRPLTNENPFAEQVGLHQACHLHVSFEVRLLQLLLIA